MHSDTGTTASTTETELDSYTATAGDFTANDEILVSMYFIPDTITHDHEDIIRIGAATDFTIHSYAASNAGVFAEATLGDSLQTSNFLSLYLVKTEAATHTTATSRAVNGGAVITGAWTISIRGKVQATGTLNYRWTIWRRRG